MSLDGGKASFGSSPSMNGRMIRIELEEEGYDMLALSREVSEACDRFFKRTGTERPAFWTKKSFYYQGKRSLRKDEYENEHDTIEKHTETSPENTQQEE